VGLGCKGQCGPCDRLPAQGHDLAIASKAKRVVGIIALMLAGLFVVLVGWIFVVQHNLPTSVGLHSFGKVDVDAWDQGLVLAEGTWRAERKPERILFLTLSKPLNISKIRCERQSGFCEVATAMLDRSASYGDYLELDLYQIEIKKWTSTALEFSIGDPALHCFIENYVITRSTQTITGLSTADGKCDEPLPKGISRVTDMNPLQLSFVAGSDLALRSRLDEEAPTRTFISGIAVTLMIGWLLFCVIWIVRVVRH
jgi:hypothetical protein